MRQTAVLALEDGTVFRGTSIGADGRASGEVVFNTAMTGYQEILTDPSYCRQLVTLTYPHIGNTGTNPEDMESARVYAGGLIIRDLPPLYYNWRATGSLTVFLQRAGVVAIADIDTRKLTRLIRELRKIVEEIAAREHRPAAEAVRRVDPKEQVRAVVHPVERLTERIERQTVGGIQSDRPDGRACAGHRINREKLVRGVVNTK